MSILTSAKSQVRAEVVGSDTPKTPQISDELISYLEYMWPDKLPDRYDGEFNIGQRFGAAATVRHLKMLHAEQRENMLNQGSA